MATKGLLARKIGMTQVFTDKGELLPVTVLEAGPCLVAGPPPVTTHGPGAGPPGFGGGRAGCWASRGVVGGRRGPSGPRGARR